MSARRRLAFVGHMFFLLSMLVLVATTARAEQARATMQVGIRIVALQPAEPVSRAGEGLAQVAPRASLAAVPRTLPRAGGGSCQRRLLADGRLRWVCK